MIPHVFATFASSNIMIEHTNTSQLTSRHRTSYKLFCPTYLVSPSLSIKVVRHWYRLPVLVESVCWYRCQLAAILVQKTFNHQLAVVIHARNNNLAINYRSCVHKGSIFRFAFYRIGVNVKGGVGCRKAFQHYAKFVTIGGQCTGRFLGQKRLTTCPWSSLDNQY